MSIGYWGSGTTSGERRFDALQSFKDGRQIIGHSTFINNIRDERPYENRKRFRSEGNGSNLVPASESVLMKIVARKSEAILVSTDSEFIQDPFSKNAKPELLPSKQHKALCCVNKFPLFSRFDRKYPGVMLIAFPTEPIYYPRESPELTGNLLLPLKYAISRLHTPERYSTTFFNIGPSSGASISQLHGQTYIYSKNSGKGYLQYVLKRAQGQWWADGVCIICDLLSGKQPHTKEFESLFQAELTIYENEHLSIRMPFAPQRFCQVRIFPKAHVESLSQLSDSVVLELGKAIAIADSIIYRLIFKRNIEINAKDRSIAVRQELDRRFHMFIDVYPVYLGFGGPELTVPLSVSTVSPEKLADSAKVEVGKYLTEIDGN